MKCQNIRDGAWRAITKFVWQLGRYEPSSPSTKELHGMAKTFCTTGSWSANVARAVDDEIVATEMCQKRSNLWGRPVWPDG